MFSSLEHCLSWVYLTGFVVCSSLETGSSALILMAKLASTCIFLQCTSCISKCLINFSFFCFSDQALPQWILLTSVKQLISLAPPTSSMSSFTTSKYFCFGLSVLLFLAVASSASFCPPSPYTFGPLLVSKGLV